MRLRRPADFRQQKATAETTFKPNIAFTPNIAGRPNFAEWDTQRAIQDGYKASTWVYIAVNRISRLAASIEWLAYHKNNDGTRGDRWPDHPFELLMANPNPYINAQDFRERFYQHLWLTGNALSKILLVQNIPVGLVPIMPNAIRPVPDETKFLDGYDLYERSGKSGHLGNDEVLHAMFLDPGNMYWGMSPLQAVARTVDTDSEAVTWNKVALQNRGATDGIFTINTPITQDEWQEARDQVKEQTSGSSNAYEPWVLGYGMTYQQISLTPLEMDWLESRKNNRTEILAVYGMPPPMAGIYDNATYDNVAASRLILWQDTIIPFLDDLKIAFTHGLAKRFGDDVLIDYDLSGVEALRQLQIQKIGAAKDLWAMGVPLTAIDAMLDIGLPNDVPGTDVGYLPITALPAGPPYTGGGSKARATKALATVEARAEYYKVFDRTRLPWERKIKTLAKDQLDTDFDTIADAYEADGETGVQNLSLGMRVTWHKMMNAFATTLVKEVGSAYYNQITGDEGKAANPAKKFDWQTPTIANQLDAWTLTRSGYIVDATLNSALSVVAAAASEGTGIVEIAQQLRAMKLTQSVFRSVLISRTEVVGYHNFAHHEAASQSDVVDTKQWVSSGDDRVRETHQDADGQEVTLEQAFTVGASQLQYPGDPSGDAGETIQCRCAVAYSSARKGLVVPVVAPVSDTKDAIPDTVIYANGH